MSGRLGKKQIEFLLFMSGATRMCLTSDSVVRGLVVRGLLRQAPDDGPTCISPAGLRRVADLIEAGVIKDAITIAEERKAGRAALNEGGER